MAAFGTLHHRILFGAALDAEQGIIRQFANSHCLHFLDITIPLPYKETIPNSRFPAVFFMILIIRRKLGIGKGLLRAQQPLSLSSALTSPK